MKTSITLEKNVTFCKKCFLIRISGFNDELTINNIPLTAEQLTFYADKYYNSYADEVEKKFYKKDLAYLEKITSEIKFSKMNLTNLTAEEKKEFLNKFYKQCFYYKLIKMTKGYVAIDGVVVDGQTIDSCAELYIQLSACQVEKEVYDNFTNHHSKFRNNFKNKNSLTSSKIAFEKFINMDFCSHLDLDNAELYNTKYASSFEKKEYNETKLKRMKLAFDCYIEFGPKSQQFADLALTYGPSIEKNQSYIKLYYELVKDPNNDYPYTIAFIKYNENKEIKDNDTCLRFIFNYCDVYDWEEEKLLELSKKTNKPVRSLKSLANFYQKGLEQRKKLSSFMLLSDIMVLTNEKDIKTYINEHTIDIYYLKSRVKEFVASFNLSKEEQSKLEDSLNTKLYTNYSNFKILNKLHQVKTEDAVSFLEQYEKYIEDIYNGIIPFANSKNINQEAREIMINSLSAKIEAFKNHRLKLEGIKTLQNIQTVVKTIQTFLESECFYIEDYFNKNKLAQFKDNMANLKEYNESLYNQLQNAIQKKREKRLNEIRIDLNSLILLLKHNSSFSILDYYLHLSTPIHELSKLSLDELEHNDFILVTRFLNKYKNDKRLTKMQIIDLSYNILMNNKSHLVTLDEKLATIDYLKDNNIPLSETSFKLAIKKHLHGELGNQKVLK